MVVRKTYAIIASLASLTVILVPILRYILYKLVDRRIATFQDELMAKYYNEVENIYREMRGWRHDFHNHIQLMKAYLELREYEEGYLNELEHAGIGQWNKNPCQQGQYLATNRAFIEVTGKLA